jgi:SAM-dependent methyltransferase
MPIDLTEKTISDFGEQWLAYRDNPGYYGSVDILADIFGPLLPIERVRGMRVAEIGAGTGRIVNMLLEAGAAQVVALEPSAAMSVLRENTAADRDRITYLQQTGERLPPGLGLDLVVSIGVLHHIPDPAPVVRAAYEALQPGGRFFVWIYGYEGNERYLRFAQPLRKVTTRLPHWVLAALSSVLSPVLNVYIVACRFIRLPMWRYMRGQLAKLPLSARRLTVYDQLNPAYAKYYRRDEAIALLTAANFKDVEIYHRHGYSWSVIAQRPGL